MELTSASANMKALQDSAMRDDKLAKLGHSSSCRVVIGTVKSVD